VNGKARLLVYVVASVAAVLGLLVVLGGCQKDQPMAGKQGTQTKAQQPAASAAKDEATPPAPQQVAQVAEQTTCPVMGGPINKDIFIEYQGKKVYFCCNGCPDTFRASPEKYLSKLPQFAR